MARASDSSGTVRHAEPGDGEIPPRAQRALTRDVARRRDLSVNLLVGVAYIDQHVRLLLGLNQLFQLRLHP